MGRRWKPVSVKHLWVLNCCSDFLLTKLEVQKITNRLIDSENDHLFQALSASPAHLNKLLATFKSWKLILALFFCRHEASHHAHVLASLQLPPLACHHWHPRWNSVHLWHSAAVVLPEQKTLPPSKRSGCGRTGTAELPPAAVSRAGQGLRGSVLQLLQPGQRLHELHEL